MKRLAQLLWEPGLLLWIMFIVALIVSRRDYGSRFWLGMAIAAIGISLWALARIQLGSSFSLSPQTRQLVTTGLYSKFRNPIYLFGAVGIVGLLVALGNWTLLVIFLALNSFQISRGKKEAKVLEATFGGRVSPVSRAHLVLNFDLRFTRRTEGALALEELGSAFFPYRA